MSKLACACGAVIDDDESACGGAILKDQDQDALWSEIETGIREFLDEAANGRRADWVRRRFPGPYPLDEDDASTLADFVHMTVYRDTLAITECVVCGRVHIQDPPGSHLVKSFSPDDGAGGGLLRSTQTGAG